MGVLAVDDPHPAGARQLQQAPDRGDGRLSLGYEQAASALDEVVLHVDHDQRGGRRVDDNLIFDGVRRNFDLQVPLIAPLHLAQSLGRAGRLRIGGSLVAAIP